MGIRVKSLLAVAGAAVLAAGCATGPYYPDYGYGGYDAYGYGPAYYGPAYVAPSVGFGYSYYDYDDRRRYRGDGHRHWRDRDGRASQPSVTPTPDTYRGPRNHAGEAIGPGYRGPPGSESP